MMEKIIKWIVSKVPFNQEMEQSGPARKDGRRKLMASLGPLSLVPIKVLVIQLFLWIIMGGDHFMDNSENPSMDNNKGPRSLLLLRSLLLVLFRQE